jgi:predicted nucleic acid-binding protein
MAATVLVDTGFLVALISRRDANHDWASAQAQHFAPPWTTCEAVLSEAFHLLASRGGSRLAALLRRRAVLCRFRFGEDAEAVLRLLAKYENVPISFADACLVRMTETANDPILLTTDADFRIYRRHARQAIPALLPG